MSDITTSTVADKSFEPTSEHASVIRLLVDGETTWDQRLIAASDWVNPILVKETRQALKSKQFAWTFILLIVLVIGWSFLAILSMVPSVYYASNGSGLLLGYILILLVPATIIIPQATFRSMASELEDGTFETLSLSMLTPRQIIMGKLSVATLQLMIYFSVLTPCIALTYLLRGVTLDMIMMLLTLVAMTSTALSVIAITMASFSKSRFLQVVLSVLLIGIQGIAAFTLGGILIGIMSNGTQGWIGWTLVSLTLLGFVMYGWLLLRCAGSVIGLVSDNRSTPIRVPLLTTGLLIAILGSFFIVLNTTDGMTRMMRSTFAVLANFLAIHWSIAGIWIMGEVGVIPTRARRTLPSTILARLFLTWLNPGAGPGFVFVMLSFIGPAMAMTIAPMVIWPALFYDGSLDLVWYMITVAAYMALFLGLCRLMMLVVFRRVNTGRMVISVGVSVLMIIGSVIGSASLSLFSNNYRTMDFEWFCFVNPFWTLAEVFPDYGNVFWKGPEAAVAVLIVWFAGGFIGILNVLLASRDVVILKIETPERVRLEASRDKGPTSFEEMQ